MQRKTIEKVISQKFDQWLNSIKDNNVKNLVRRNTIITGGCITSLFLNEEVNDFDVYFTNRKTVIAVADYYIKLFNKRKNGKIATLATDETHKFLIDQVAQQYDGKDCDVVSENNGNEFDSETEYHDDLYDDEKQDLGNLYGINSQVDELLDNMKKPNDTNIVYPTSATFKKFDLEHEMEKEEGAVKIFIESNGEAREQNPTKDKFRPVYLTDNSITLSDDIQIIIRFWGDAEKIHENFDYVHCTNYWESDKRKLFTNIEALECILSKTLVYRGSKYPLCSIIRSRKFINRGWKINAGQYLKMCLQLNELDLKDINVLREQLIGVDIAYFRGFLDALEAKMKLDGLFEKKKEDYGINPGLDTTYLMVLIDKIFDGDQESDKIGEEND